MVFESLGFVSSRELLRSDLAPLLHDACGPGIEHRSGESVASIEDDGRRVRAGFRSGSTEDSGVVVAADPLLVLDTFDQIRSTLP